MAVRIQILECCLFFLAQDVIASDSHSVRHRLEPLLFTVPYMGKKHISRIPVPDLQRMQVQTVPVCVYVQKKLRRIPDPRHSIKGMPSPYQREEGHRIQLKQIGTGHTEKIPHHQIRIPDRLQLGKAVKYIKGLSSFLPYSLVNPHRKAFKPLFRLKFIDSQPFAGFQHSFMLRKPDINKLFPVLQRLCRKRTCEKKVFLQVGNLKHNIISKPDKIQRFIHSCNSAQHLVKCRHIHTPLFCVFHVKKKRRRNRYDIDSCVCNLS